MVTAAAIIAIFANTVPAAQKPSPAEPKYTEIKYSADTSSYRWHGGDRILSLKGNVKFVQGDTVLLADIVDYEESTRTANASGSLEIHDDQNTITGDLCSMSFKEKKGTLTGSVRMVAKPKPKPSKAKSLKSEWKDEVVITCDKVDYFYEEKKAVISSAVTIVQKGKTVTADSAIYLGKEEIVQLVGNVKGRDDEKKHTFSAPKVTMSLREDDEWIEAEKATGSFYIEEEEESAEVAEPDA